jgi:hypothetical protein
VTVENLPPQHPLDAVEVLVEGYTETIAPHSWTAAMSCSPAGPWNIGVREDTADRARRDTADSSLFADIDEDDTAPQVFTNSGPIWTSEAADYPFDLDIGGERVTATAGVFFAVTVFTVVRSVNGVVKSHAAGTPVRLWQPAYRAL